MTSQHGAYALCAGLARLYARMRMHTSTRPGTHIHARASMHTHRPMCNTYCFSSATVVTRTRLNVTLSVHYLSCFTYLLYNHLYVNYIFVILHPGDGHKK